MKTFTNILLVVSTYALVGSIGAINLPERSREQPLKWWQEEVVYQIYPRSFQDSDGLPEEEATGDLKGITSRLDYLQEVGVGSVWISPIYKSPMVDFGYDISDFRDIDPIFGTMEDFRAMSKAMKDKNIKLIMDFVPNHSSDKHEWFEKSVNRETRYVDYYVWRDANMESGDRQPPNNWRSVFGGPAWTWNEKRGQYYLHQFTPEQPDLNFENTFVKLEMHSVINFWIAEGVDGFRMDAVPHIFEDQSFDDEEPNPNPPPNADCAEANSKDHSCLLHDKTYNLPAVLDFLAELRAQIDQASTEERELVMMVEATIPDLDGLFKYYGTDERPIAHYPFNFEFINRIKKGFTGTQINNLVNEWYTKMPAGRTANWLLGNHDNGRVGSRFSPEDIDSLNMINLLLPGSSVTYYGEEIGMLNRDLSWKETKDPPGCNAGEERYHLFSRDPARTPMQWDNTKNAGFSTADKTWLPVHQNHQTVNVKAQMEADPLTHLHVYNMLIEKRKTDVWRFGTLVSDVRENGNLFSFKRTLQDGKEGFALMANFGAGEITADLSTIFTNIPSKATVYLTSTNFEPSNLLKKEIETKGIKIPSKHAIIVDWKPANFEVPTSSTPPATSPNPSSTTAGAASGTFNLAVLLAATISAAFFSLS